MCLIISLDSVRLFNMKDTDESASVTIAEFMNGSHWGLICDKEQRSDWANNFCKELSIGFSGAMTVTHVQDGKIDVLRQRPITLRNPKCDSYDTKMKMCTSESLDCSYQHVVAVSCTGKWCCLRDNVWKLLCSG